MSKSHAVSPTSASTVAAVDWNTLLQHQPVACSTLDLLRPLTPRKTCLDQGKAQQHLYDSLDLAPEPVRREMLAIAIAAEQQAQDKRARGGYTSPRAKAATIASLGDLSSPQKRNHYQQPLPHPVTRKLEDGRSVRQDGVASDSVSLFPTKSSLGASRSAPCLSSTDDGDALDRIVLATVASPSPSRSQSSSVQQHPSHSNEDAATAQLYAQRQLLENRLLHVTQKLCRKYTTQLFMSTGKTTSTRNSVADPEATRVRAEKWSHADALSEQEKDALYMAGHFQSQQQLAHYPRELEQRDAASNRHRRHTSHTKYGDALARTRASLRGAF